MNKYSIRRPFLKLAMCSLLALNLHNASAVELVVPKPKGASGQHKIELLKLIAKHADQPITVVQKETSNRIQEINMLNTQQLNVMWAPKTADLESQLHAVKVPLDKDIVGSVAIIIRKQDLAKFSAVNELRQLKAMQAGVRKDTVTRQILEQHSFGLVSTLRGHYGYMLDGERFDYFPVAASNAYSLASNWAQSEQLDLMVYPDLLLKLPLNSYFYVEKGNVQLANVIESALHKAIESGDFDKLLKSSPGYQAAQQFYQSDDVKVMDILASL
ncbi:hypothetical protein IC617_04225 [Neiella sp. HB171785]|uniref:Solute-binding protein family 3/N-terminal domain-containing protein n=1 Tax=Neiella litorisoli TaxID=2771431 RepID=A0A8J6QTA7_9GAMM|nr:hypothetical protein [Neiella litorisoli]MBD1388627.1 hypothetical protein [Neiella litorisoli]